MGVNYISTSDINSGLSRDAQSYIEKSEDIYKTRLEQAAEFIYADRFNKPLVLLSGPSGSGKTTSAMRIAELLRLRGSNVHTISMDNYFIPGDIENLPVDENGKADLESPNRVDIELFSKHLQRLFKCEPVNVPIFEFATQSRRGSVPLHRENNDIIIIEGIHALNPSVTGNTDSFTTCLYVSVRTRIRSGDGSILHPRKIRLMRRLNRDCLFRNRKPEAVIEMYKSVTRGEEKYIMPYKYRADFSIDTFIAYEAAVYAKMLGPVLSDRNVDLSSLPENDIMTKILDELTPISDDIIPSDSLVREFVGGSSLSY